MKYIINSDIVFDTIEYTLTSLKHSNLLVKLSSPAGQILEELIKYRNNDTPVTREHLFKVVWIDHGLEPSHGNLNQQISLIRKTLVTFGLCASFILTMPKRGLKLNNHITVKQIQEDPCDINSTPNVTLNKNNMFQDSLLLSFKTYTRYIMMLIVTITIIFSMSSIYLYNKSDNVKLYCCKEINLCNICTLPEISNFECKSHQKLDSEVT